MYTLTLAEIAKAVRAIINTDEQQTNNDELLVSTKDDAETLSELFLQTGKGGSMDGPYLQPINGIPTKFWIVQK